MKAIGRNIVLKKNKEDTVSKTDGGLLLTNSQRVDVRYKKGEVLYIGEEVKGINAGDIIYYDKNASHRLEVDKEVFAVITYNDIVAVV